MVEIRSKATGRLIHRIMDAEIGREKACAEAEKERQRWNASQEFPKGVYVTVQEEQP